MRCVPQATRRLITGILVMCGGPTGQRLAEGAPGAPTGVIVHGEAPAAPAGQDLRRTVRRILDGHPAFATIPMDIEMRLFATAPTPEPGPALATTMRALNAARKQLRAFDLGPARRSLRRARQAVAPVRLLDEAAPLERLRVELLVALAHLKRNERAMERHLAEYTSRFGSALPESGLWPPDIVRRLSASGPVERTLLQIESQPPGQARVNGERVGRTPLAIELGSGQHRVEVRAPGHLPGRGWAQTLPGNPTLIRLELGTDVGPVLEGAATLNPSLVARLSDLARAASLKHLVAVSRPAPGQVRLQLLNVPELGRANVMSPVIARERPRDLEAALGQLSSQRLAYVVSTSEAPPALVWAGLIGGAAMTATGITLRLLAQGSQNEFRRKQGALTQVEAFSLRDDADQKATAGAVLLGLGAAAVAGFASWAAFELWGTD